MGSDRVTYVGHATTVIEVDGVRLLTDPVLRDRVGHIRRIAPSPQARFDVDAILVSHSHHDHLDLPSLRTLDPELPVIGPAGVVDLIRGRTGRRGIALEVGERHRLGEVEVIAVQAEHNDRRTPVGPQRGALGFVVAGSARVYFAGDTDLFPAMNELGDLDVALIPVWGWGPRVGPGHLDPERGARAAGLLRPRIAVPIHWGTLAGPRVWWRDEPRRPAEEFERLAATHAPGVQVRILAPGEELPL